MNFGQQASPWSAFHNSGVGGADVMTDQCVVLTITAGFELLSVRFPCLFDSPVRHHTALFGPP